MMTVEIIEDPHIMDAVPWREYSERELAQAGEMREVLWAQSAERWVVKSDGHVAALAGVLKRDLIGQPLVWFLLAKDVRWADLKAARPAVRAVMHDRFPGAVTGIDESEPANVRFAKFLGLTPTQGSIEVAGHKFTYYGVA